MKNHYTDPCLSYLYEAQLISNKYKPVNELQLLLESGDDDTLVANDEVVKKSKSALQKACEAIQTLIKNIIGSIKNFIDKSKLNAEDKQKFDEFLKSIQSDPELRNKKVTVADWKTYNKEYDEILKDVDHAINDSDKMSDEMANKVISNINDKLKKVSVKVATGAATVVSMDIARKLADSSRTSAKIIGDLLESENGILDHLSKTVGTRGAKNFQNQIKNDGRLISFRRLKVKILNKKYDSAKDCFSASMKGIKDVTKLKPTLGNIDLVRDTVRVGSPDKNPDLVIAKGAIKGAKFAYGTSKTVSEVKRMRNFITGK